MNGEIRIELDGGAIARAMVEDLNRSIARGLIAPLDAFNTVVEGATARTITADQAFRTIGKILRHTEVVRRRRAKYEIREAIAARRLGVAPQPWRGR